jgi:hypothetical protein
MSLVLFVISGAVIAFLIIHKQVEVTYGRGLIMKNLAHNADVWFHTRFTSLGKITSKITPVNIVRTLNFAFVWLARVFLAFGSFVSKNVRELVTRLAHREGSLDNTGAASFYLKQIKENKDELKK